MNNKRNLIITIVAALIITTIGTSYGLLKSSVLSSNPYTMNVGTIRVDFFGTTNSLSLSNVAPMSDEDGMNQNDILEFTVKNTGDIQASYDVYIDETSSNPSFKPVIRYAVNKNNTGYGEVLGVVDNMLYIDKNQILEVNGTANYKLKIWLGENADNTYMNKTFTAKIAIVSKQVVTLNADNISFTPLDASTCRGGVECNDVQLILEKIAGMLN